MGIRKGSVKQVIVKVFLVGWAENDESYVVSKNDFHLLKRRTYWNLLEVPHPFERTEMTTF